METHCVRILLLILCQELIVWNIHVQLHACIIDLLALQLDCSILPAFQFDHTLCHTHILENYFLMLGSYDYMTGGLLIGPICSAGIELKSSTIHLHSLSGSACSIDRGSHFCTLLQWKHWRHCILYHYEKVFTAFLSNLRVAKWAPWYFWQAIKYQAVLFGFLFTHTCTLRLQSLDPLHGQHMGVSRLLCSCKYITNPTTSVQLINCDLLIAYCYSLII